ncbi:MAG: hypothetical protein KY455_06580 [Euryarchaeota archaeon]|nr:hypothetical protein [Euryarchaeota archaeon]
MRPGRLVVVAVLGNLLIATGLGYVVAPVEMSEATLAAYDGMPSPLRRLLGDASSVESDEASYAASGAMERGPVGRFLAGFLANALEGDPEAQVRHPLALSTDKPLNAWHADGALRVSWPTYGDALTYHIDIVPNGTTPEPIASPEHVVEAADHVDLALTSGLWTVAVQATYGDVTGPVATLGPVKIDDTPPAPPLFPADAPRRVTVYSYEVAWLAASDLSGIDSYSVERAVGGGPFTRIHETPGDLARILEHNRPNGDYRYRVSAVNGAGLVSAPSEPFYLTVDARGGLTPPPPGAYDHGIHAVYDSLLIVHDISDPSRYYERSDLPGSLSAEEHQRYLASGWGIETENEELRRLTAELIGADYVDGELVGGEQNTLKIGMTLFRYLFEATDYDFKKFASAQPDFQRASETLSRGLGICGDLTALYVTLMRIAGVPARPVHGYLINDNEAQRIGGFHMWAEIYVGGDDPVGGGWIPVDVSGVTGSFEPKHYDFYFGIANPSYLQLGVQDDLGDDALPLTDSGEEPLQNRWNIWANLQWYYRSADGDSKPQITFDSAETVKEVSSQGGWLFFDAQTHERRFCATTGDGEEEKLVDDSCRGDMRSYYKGLKGSSKRVIDYGATLRWDDDRVSEVTLMLKFPEQAAPNQAVMYTVYERAGDCTMRTLDPVDLDRGDGFLHWTLPGDTPRCMS